MTIEHRLHDFSLALEKHQTVSNDRFFQALMRDPGNDTPLLKRTRTSVVLLVLAIALGSHPARAEQAGIYMQLAFPDIAPSLEGEEYLRTINEFGNLKITDRMQICVFSSDEEGRRTIEDALGSVVRMFPWQAQSRFDLSCDGRSVEEVSMAPILLWHSVDFRTDASTHFEHLQMVPNLKYSARMDAFQNSIERGRKYVSMNAEGHIERGSLLLKDYVDSRWLKDEIFQFVYALLDPKSIAGVSPIRLLDRSSGDYRLSEIANNYMALLYSSEVRFGATKSEFQSALSRCLEQNRC